MNIDASEPGKGGLSIKCPTWMFTSSPLPLTEIHHHPSKIEFRNRQRHTAEVEDIRHRFQSQLIRDRPCLGSDQVRAWGGPEETVEKNGD
ncbi:hypothetical protein TNCT_215291 [Trichonephila clavata]|uniref:Uncharacterized protein n=1 Tax=Trichonephila clavata TaxID=2740835 RepID=A0A8X6H0A0_TRICU|nr:hypothetical protein TNCT_215291 [Trichonephila clavata]